MHIISIREDHMDFLDKRRIRTWLHRPSRWGIGHQVIVFPFEKIEPYSAYLFGSMFWTMGSFSYSWSELATGVSVGRYCSIAADVKVTGGNHPLSDLSTSSMFYDRTISVALDIIDDFGISLPVKFVDKTKHPPIIEHDVWIGQGALIGRGVTIGTGAVIAAGSVVVKNVEPYSIVAGNPAQHIRFRFDEGLCRDLLESRWWRFALPQFADMDYSDPALFLKQLREREGDMEEFAPTPTLGSELLAL